MGCTIKLTAHRSRPPPPSGRHRCGVRTRRPAHVEYLDCRSADQLSIMTTTSTSSPRPSATSLCPPVLTGRGARGRCCRPCAPRCRAHCERAARHALLVLLASTPAEKSAQLSSLSTEERVEDAGGHGQSVSRIARNSLLLPCLVTTLCNGAKESYDEVSL